MKILLAIWRYRRVWKKMIDLWEADCVAVDVCLGIMDSEYVAARTDVEVPDRWLQK